MALVGIFESTHALVDDWYNHVQYLSVFLLGFLIAKAGPAWDAMQRLRARGIVPDVRVFQLAVDFFQTLDFGVVVKDTPGAHAAGR